MASTFAEKKMACNRAKVALSNVTRGMLRSTATTLKPCSVTTETRLESGPKQ